jgi:hypothetical protein
MGRLGWRLEVAEKIFQKSLKNPLTNARAFAIIQSQRENKEENKMMTNDYWEAHEAEWLAAQECMEWLLFEADMATDPYRED